MCEFEFMFRYFAMQAERVLRLNAQYDDEKKKRLRDMEIATTKHNKICVKTENEVIGILY